MSKSCCCNIGDGVEHVLNWNMQVMHSLVDELKFFFADSGYSEDTGVRQSS
jgi:hypothetical protein